MTLLFQPEPDAGANGSFNNGSFNLTPGSFNGGPHGGSRAFNTSTLNLDVLGAEEFDSLTPHHIQIGSIRAADPLPTMNVGSRGVSDDSGASGELGLDSPMNSTESLRSVSTPSSSPKTQRRHARLNSADSATSSHDYRPYTEMQIPVYLPRAAYEWLASVVMGIGNPLTAEAAAAQRKNVPSNATDSSTDVLKPSSPKRLGKRPNSGRPKVPRQASGECVMVWMCRDSECLWVLMSEVLSGQGAGSGGVIEVVAVELVPVLFTQGVNEMQSVANRVGDTSSQVRDESGGGVCLLVSATGCVSDGMSPF